MKAGDGHEPRKELLPDKAKLEKRLNEQKAKRRAWFNWFRRIKSLRNKMILITAAIMLATSLFTFGVFFLLMKLIPDVRLLSPLVIIVSALIACTVIGTLSAAFVSLMFYRPFKEMLRATEKIAKGDFKVRLEQIADPQTDFGMVQTSFNHMAEELDGIEMFRNDFINNFSHEFKTPIVSIRGFAHQLQAGGLTPEEEKEYVRIIADEADRLTKMSTNILLLSKLENQQIVTDKTEFYLDEQIRTALVMLEKQWSQKNIELDIDLDEVTYRFNEEMLAHVWINLFGNAIKFTPDCGTVSCTLRKQPDAVVVSVRDTGVGMSREVADHIFEKFYQGDTSHNGDGNGIGLNIVRRVLELCGGRIDVDSAPGLGSTFTVTLPVTEGTEDPETTAV
ncbi:MAG: HAMP domain-containing histidine kinase [Clostridia bacterium]|nr:HAMP domain-containing histidine kinase [Clostridia bacterium]